MVAHCSAPCGKEIDRPILGRRYGRGSAVRAELRAAARSFPPFTELRRGVAEYCVLAVLRDAESYAFDIVRVLAQAGGLVTSEGTIYPLLARLRRDDLVTTSWRKWISVRSPC
ncbi:MAG: PadR family transcriptional regulator [Chloroflexota bacterium]